MKKLFLLFIFCGLFSCNDIIDPPKNLVEEDKMSEVIAELALSDQLSMVSNNFNSDSQTRFILKKLKVDSKNFTDSYKYYIAKKKMPKIYEKAQEIIKNKDPKSEIFIDKKLAEQDSIRKKEEERTKQTQN